MTRFDIFVHLNGGVHHISASVAIFNVTEHTVGLIDMCSAVGFSCGYILFGVALVPEAYEFAVIITVPADIVAEFGIACVGKLTVIVCELY